ncbi:hypothetical protein ACIRBX_19250 [Kitasatospora sp. NPDC096147]|uniref:hypothetical protein n=1 Tax=Kitasatospora sp. NPDC096147 TaxID=3364093 RepID=UPI00380719A2
MDVAQTVEAAMPSLLAVAGPVLAGVGEAATRTSAALGRRLLERLFGLSSGGVVPPWAEPLPAESEALVRAAVRQAVEGDPLLRGRLESLVRGGHVSGVGQGMAMAVGTGTSDHPGRG